MSFDLYLLPARAVHLDAQLARDFLERENANFARVPIARDPDCERKKRELADLLVRLKPNYVEFPIDFERISDWEKISVEEAQLKYRYIEMNGRPKPADAQFVFFDHYVVVHRNSGTCDEEIDAILYSLSLTGDFVVFDPQANEIFDLRE